MRLYDIVTPEELHKIFEREYREVAQLGKRDDLVKQWMKSIGDRISKDYLIVCEHAVPNDIIATQMWRMLCLIDRFLEEKYSKTKEVQ